MIDNNKHTVTIPFSDYNNLIGMEPIAENAIKMIKSHFRLLQENDIEFSANTNFLKTPIGISKKFDSASQKILFTFEYEK